MSDLLKRLENLSPEKRELVLQKLKQRSQSGKNNGQQKPLLTPVSREQNLPLSFAQTRLWFLAQLIPENNPYHVPIFWQLKGDLNQEALEQAIAEIINRHEVLRTNFSLVNESPIQVINSPYKLTIPVINLEELTAEIKSEKTRQLAIEELQKSFDLETDNLVRGTLLKLDSKSHILLLVIHHIVFDGWSVNILRQEFSSLYKSFCDKKPSDLPKLSLQYADFAYWQRQWLEGERLENQLNYWRQQLNNAPPLLELPTDQPRPSVQTYQGASHFFALNQTLTKQLKYLSQKSGTTLFMTLLTAFKLLLARYSGQSDILVGTAIANRHYQEIESLMGFFVNTLALRTNLEGNPTFLELLQQVKQNTLEAYDHQDLPFEKLADELQIERSLSHHPLFQVAFTLQNETEKTLQLPELSLSPFDWENTTTLFDLSLACRETPQGIVAEFEYATDLFTASTIQRMGENFVVLLEGIVTNPQQTINTLPLLTKSDQEKLQIWNQTDTKYPQDKTLVDLFEEQVKTNPDNIALVFEQQNLTYQELNQKANQVAHYLQQNHALEPDTLIAICVDRSLEMIIGLLGVLKAGAAYVPIDPKYPEDRIKFILEDSRTSILLTQSFLKDKLSLNQLKKFCKVTCLDQFDFESFSNNNLISQSKPNDLAYVIYTSGSTGRPKGVMIEHKSIVNLSLTFKENFKVHPQSRLLQFGSFSFDLSIGEIASNLVAGACLYLAKQETLLPSQTLVDFLAVNQITHNFLPPSALSVLPQASLPKLENIGVGGEACSQEVVEKWATQRRFFNCYGPTETTVTATLALCHPQVKNPPIGKPLANLRAYILDANQQILPPGIPGELCIAGVGLARGYLNRPDLTAEKFIEVNILGKTELIYKTGDLAKWRQDGNLEFLGRIDQQVKLRGFRIELGEIEASLVQHPNIQQAVVLLREDTDFAPRLVAYVIPSEKEKDSEVEHLQDEQVELWQQIFDDGYYDQQASIDDPTLNITGWNDSYTGQLYSQKAMAEWRDTTVAQILGLEPKRVWEIACGTGMLLFKVAPHCQEYLGTDFSQTALQYVAQYLKPQNLEQKVTLKPCPANQFEGIEEQSYDLVIMNSVIQYFPSVDYLLEVLEGAIKAVETGGQILIGDVRNFQLLEAFHTAVEFYRAEEEVSSQELRQRIKNSIRTEEELLIDPDLFIALQQKYPRISQVQIQLKRGNTHTEMSRFRYDVVLYLDQPPSTVKEWHWLDWQTEQLDLSQIANILATEKPDLLGIQNIPNPRLSSEMALLDKMRQFTGTVKELKEILSQAEAGIEPETFFTLTPDLPYTPFIQYSDSGFSTYQVVWQRNSTKPFTLPRFASENTLQPRSWQDYANQPLTVDTYQVDAELLNQWREFLGQTLPDYMIPGHFVQLAKLPLTPNGKIDRKSLPAPDTTILSREIELPATPTEELLAQIWAKLLKYEGISRQDNFFNLGGHSLLATQLVTRIRNIFGVELAVGKVFEHSILSELAIAIDQANSAINLPPLIPQPPNEPKVLSFAQSRLWFIAQLEGAETSVTYNMPSALELKGNLNIEALRASFEYLLERHTILRTSFPALSGEAQILIHNSENMDVLEIVDLQALAPQTQAETVQRLVDLDAQDPFDLNTGSLFKAKLLQLSQEKNILLLNMHHIISDGWSMGVFKQEWEQSYAALVAGNQPNLSPLPIQYSDYAAWQRSWLQGEILARQEKYWKQQLGDAPRLLDLPTDYPRPAKQSYQGGREEYDLNQQLTQKLKSLSQQQGVSLFMTLLTAFNILLSRYSRQEDLCIGTGIANRTHSDTEKLIGFFVNTLVLRSQVKPDQTFSDLLQQSRQTCLDAYAHQDIPFEYLVEKLQPERSLSYNSLCQVAIVLQNTARAGTSVNLTGLEIQDLEQTYPFAKLDLTLDLSERDGQLHCMWEYASDLFEVETIQRMAGHFEVLLQGIVDNPQQTINNLPWLTEADRKQLQSWNQTDSNYPQDKTLVDLFEEQVKINPDNIALVFEQHKLTYQELNKKANQVAHYLQQNYHIEPDTLIGICVDRSLEMIIGLLGVLKSGAAYVPIDPEYPKDRIQFILQDTEISVLLTQSFIQEKLSLNQLIKSCEVIYLDKSNFDSLSTNNLTTQTKPNNLAYVIYTSGSTGRPKGVMIEHLGLTNIILEIADKMEVESQSRWLQMASFSFDMSVAEIATTLATGACLYLINQEILLSSQTLVDFLSQHQISHIVLSPSLLSVVPNSPLPDLQYIGVGGEAVSAELVKQWGEGRNLFNGYAPTESTILATLAVCRPDGQNPTIGKPLDNIRVYILDANQQILPPGIPGELCIAGLGLARGYLNRLDLTSEKFIEVNLFGKTERIYKTGDLAKWRQDGNLEFLGRIDHQVKLRGFRIELGEIESSLVQDPNIQEAVVMLREDADFDPRLVAYIVPSESEKDSQVEDLQGEQVELWQQIFDDGYYDQQTPTNDPTLNFTGWNDSYTGQAYSQKAMAEWRDTTVAQILELEPQQVWEIGCGTGMLLFKIAPHCQEFLGTDFSQTALQYVGQYLKPQNLEQKVTLKQRSAHELAGIEDQNYDLVIMNSVIQYFPSIDYLLEVIERAIKAVATGGKILIGDVRNFRLLEAFHTAVEFYRAEKEVSSRELRQRIQNSIRTEEELLIDPDFFIALQQKYPRISQVQIELKRGDCHTEMNRFRYDVILYLDQTQTPVKEWQWLDWSAEQLDLSAIANILTTQQPDLLGIQNIPNARLSKEMVLLTKMPQFIGMVKELKEIIAQVEIGIEPEAFFTLASELPYTPFIQYSDSGFSTYQVVWQRNTTKPFTLPRFATKSTLQKRAWQDYANQPLTVDTPQINPALLSQWREFLGQTLPDYMIPSHFVPLEKLPLTPNGKIDRKGLPVPNQPILSTDIELPETPTEELLAQIWAKLLKYEGISRQDNFFNLGGHSLLATQLIARIREQFQVELSVSKVFEYPTLQELANCLDTYLWVNSAEDDQPLNSDEEEIEI